MPTDQNWRPKENLPIMGCLCPHCDWSLQCYIGEGQHVADVLASCPKCGRKYKVPTIAAELVEGPANPNATKP